jgi:uncharacterized protein with NRDE domain
MCIILFAYRAHPDYRLILAANRDEYDARPTAQAAFWEDAPEILAGRDLLRGGTWLGVTRSGRVAAVTNFRDSSAIKKDAPSRGHLVSDFLRSTESPQEYLERRATTSSVYDGFNLIAGDSCRFAYHSNRGAGVRALTEGVYGVSNHLLDTPWPKVSRGKQALSEIVRRDGEVEPEALFDILADESRAADEALPDTGVGVELERVLSPLFIRTPIYGTRSSTLLLIDIKGSITFIERTFEAGRKNAADVVFKFKSEGEDV